MNAPSNLGMVRRLEQEVHVLCVAISPDSEIVAVGQWVRSSGSDRAAPAQHYAAIQLYSSDLIPEEMLKCRAAGDKEFPRNISFYSDGQTMLYSCNRTFGVWTRERARGVISWQETSLGSLDAKVVSIVDYVNLQIQMLTIELL